MRKAGFGALVGKGPIFSLHGYVERPREPENKFPDFDRRHLVRREAVGR